MASDTTKFRVRVAASRVVLSKLPRECPSWYNANLKIAALERAVEKFYKQFWVLDVAPVLGGKVSEKKKKKAGDALAVLNEKDKKAREALNKTLEEAFFKKYPDKVTPKQYRRLMVDTHREYEKFLASTAQDLKKKALASALASLEGLSGLDQPGKKLKS